MSRRDNITITKSKQTILELISSIPIDDTNRRHKYQLIEAVLFGMNVKDEEKNKIMDSFNKELEAIKWVDFVIKMVSMTDTCNLTETEKNEINKNIGNTYTLKNKIIEINHITGASNTKLERIKNKFNEITNFLDYSDYINTTSEIISEYILSTPLQKKIQETINTNWTKTNLVIPQTIEALKKSAYDTTMTDKPLLSIDIRSANYTVVAELFRRMLGFASYEESGFSPDWKTLVRKFTNDELIINSKINRQVIISKINKNIPNMMEIIETAERYIIMNILSVINKYMQNEFELIFKHNDEIVFNIKKESNTDENIKQIKNLLKIHTPEHIKDWISDFIHIKPYILTKHKKQNGEFSGAYIKKFYDGTYEYKMLTPKIRMEIENNFFIEKVEK